MRSSLDLWLPRRGGRHCAGTRARPRTFGVLASAWRLMTHITLGNCASDLEQWSWFVWMMGTASAAVVINGLRWTSFKKLFLIEPFTLLWPCAELILHCGNGHCWLERENDLTITRSWHKLNHEKGRRGVFKKPLSFLAK